MSVSVIILVVAVKSFSPNSVSLRAVLLVLVIVAASVSAVFAYLHLSKDTRVRTVTVFPPYELSMELEKTVFNLGESVNVTISVKNIGNETITVVWGSSSRFDFNVTDANETFVYRFTWVRFFTGAEKRVNLLPGEEFSEIMKWDQTRVTVEGDKVLEYGIPVERGIYSIVGMLDTEPYLVTPPIQVTIV